jgi:hypothetical protein
VVPVANELAAYYISLIPSAKGLTKNIAKEFSGVDSMAERTGKSSGARFSGAFKASMAGIGGVLAAAGIGSFVSDAVKGAGSLEQSLGALDSVFKGNSGQMKAWSKQAATDVGLTQNEFNELGTLIGSQLKNGGTAMDELAPKTKDLIGMGADLSSMFGGSTKDAVDALSSALKGERDPIERYGVSLNQAKIDAEAAALGFAKVGGAWSAEASQAATVSLIMKQTTDAHGNFAKESDTFAHKQQVMTAEWGNLTTKIGELFLPVMTTTFAFISDKVIPVFTEGVGGVRAFGAAFKAADGDITSNGFPGFMERMAAGAIGLHDLIVKGDYRGLLRTAFGWEEDSPIVDFLLDLRDGVIAAKDALVDAGGWVVKNKDWLLTLAVTVGSVVAAYKTYTTALAVHAATTAIYTAVSSAAGGAQAFFAGAAFTAALGVTALNTALKANLFGIIALAVIGLVSGLVYFFTQTEAGKKIVAVAWEGIQSVVGAVVDWFTKDALPAIQSFVGGIVGFFEDLGRGTEESVAGVRDGVGGVVSFFEGTVAPAFKAVFDGIGAAVKTVFDGIGAVFNWFYQSVVVPVVNGVKAYVGFLVAAFVGIYTFLKPAFDSLGVILNGFRMFFEGVFNLVVAYVQKIVIPLFMMFWTRMVEAFNGVSAAIGSWWNDVTAAFTAVGEAISGWWNNTVMPVFNAVVSFVRQVLAAVFTWYLNNVIMPVWNGVTNTIKLAWAAISAVLGVMINFVRSNLAAAFTWFRDNVIKPVWNGITSFVRAAWTNISSVFNTIVTFLRTTLSAAFTWFRDNVISPVWNGISSTIKNVWEKNIKPVFDTMSNFITKTIPRAFDTGVAAIKKAWDKLIETAKSPVRFVINSVINDGLIKGFNDLARPLGVKELGRVALPAGFANGGYTGDGGKYDPAGVVHKGEYVFTKAQTAAIGKDRLADLAHGAAAGVAPFAGQSADLWGSLQEDIKRRRALNVSGSAPAWSLPAAIRAWDGAAGLRVKPGLGSPNASVTTMPFGAQFPSYAIGYAFEDGGIALNSAAEGRLSPLVRRVAAIHEIGHVLGLPHVTNRASIMHPMLSSAHQPTAFDIANVQRMYGGKGVPSGDSGGGGFNPLSGIIDGLVQKFKDTFKDAGVFADLAIGIGKKIFADVSGWVGSKLGFGGDGQSATVYDGGGWLENTGGSQLVQHNKRKPDAVLSSSQWDTMTRIADNARGGFVNHGTINVRDEEEMARIILTRQRDAQAAYGF